MNTFHRESDRGDEATEQEGIVLYRDNLIYLPFASHLAEEDAEQEKKAA